VLSLRPPDGAGFVAEENVIAGNTILYGATAGRAFFRGLVGERFAVRNSGASAVVEGVGDHGCEYMTGGIVAVLGRTGRNFAAGMSGGEAYILDEDGTFESNVNKEMVALEKLEDPAEVAAVYELVRRHADLTRSNNAFRVIAQWEDMVQKFVKVMPKDYKRMLGCIRQATEDGLSGDDALIAAFEANAKDLARVGGG
jgi:glutamate synthase (ferredoxin)